MMYDELIYHLDLCILAYHLHSQTLIWPMDPYYEQMIYYRPLPNIGEQKDRRNKFMEEVRKKFKPPFTIDSASKTSNYHGPGSCMGDSTTGWNSNELLDPIISNYNRINPWLPSFTLPNSREKTNRWIVYNTPKAITETISDVYMVRYKEENGPYSATVDPIVEKLQVTPVSSPSTPATDLLYCFEGGTGAIGEAKEQKKFASWSMMGFVLARKVSDGSGTSEYDIHIVFRGSRSGEVRKVESAWNEKGNPDWATDLDLLEVVKDEEISQFGSVCRGFRTSIKTMLPTIIKCLDDIHFNKSSKPPRRIYVTGHSLGGALACHFTSAMVMGNNYGPDGNGSKMPNSLKSWPWRSTQVITFGAPAVGDETFQWVFHNTLPSRRVWLAGDPITTDKTTVVGVGALMPIAKGTGDVLRFSFDSHEPFQIRRYLIQQLEHYKVGVSNTVPANTGKEESSEPYKYFTNCQDMLIHLNSLGSLQNQLFPNFKDLFDIYLNLLESVIKTEIKETTNNKSENETKIKYENNYKNFIGIYKLLSEKTTIDVQLKYLEDSYNLFLKPEDVHKTIIYDIATTEFLYLCLFLFLLSVDSVTVWGTFNVPNSQIPELSKLIKKI